MGNLVTSASGSFTLRWAAGTNTGTSTKLLQYSRLMVARRI
jgi:hypothetical protein